MSKWTYDDIPSQEGRIAIVTGANSGLGYWTSKGLAAKGCEVIMACRNIEKAGEARQAIMKDLPGAKLRIMKLDLASLKSVRGFSQTFVSEYRRLDLLINNAGLMAIPYRETEEGFEMQFGVNHLGHFALSGQLFELLRKTGGSRVVNVSSAAHNLGEIRFEDIHWKKGYNKWKAYAMSKLANIHFTHELADRVSNLGLGIKVLAAHPGYADSSLIEKGPEMEGRKLFIKLGKISNRIVAQSAEMGALPTLYAATAEEAVHRGYYGPRGFSGMRGYPERTYPNRKKVSKDVQEKLWTLSQSLTGVSFL